MSDHPPTVDWRPIVLAAILSSLLWLGIYWVLR
jgi:hypothetical protein